MKPLLSVVVPMYRTAPMLAEFHRRTVAAVPASYDAEIIYVDDGCDQGSAAALAALQQDHLAVRVETHQVNQGQHHAIRTGLGASSGDVVVVLDADLQDPPEAIPSLIERLQLADVDAVFAGKHGQYQSRVRMMSGGWFKLVMHRAGGVPRDAGGYVAMTRALVDDVLARQLSSPYLLLSVAVTRRPTTSIPVARSPRERGKSATSTRTRLRLGVGALRGLWDERQR